MKARLFLFAVLLCLAGCSLIWGPTATVKKFMAAAEKGDVDTMTSLLSSRTIQKLGINNVRDKNQRFSELIRQPIAAGGKPIMSELKEVVYPSRANATVTLVYQDKERNDSLGLGFELLKEDGVWKIDTIGGRELSDSGWTSSASPGDSPKEETKLLVPVPSPPESATASSSPSLPTATRPPINGGILNGKALSLPQPSYPPIARAAKASGTVVVRVLVDENGNVISASAVSGHPLLQAVSVAAARAVKFSPTKLSGQPVKVSGTIIYKFDAQQ